MTLEEKVLSVPRQFRDRLRRVLTTGNSYKQAIFMQCVECQGWDDSALAEAKKCTSVKCPLWRYRPGQRLSSRKHLTG